MIESVAWPIAAVSISGVAGWCSIQWVKARQLREERETGAVAKLARRADDVADEIKRLQTDWKAFQVNNRR
jgi:hypothetical protein